MMKFLSLIFTFCFLSLSYADDYQCRLPFHQLTLQLDEESTTLWVMDPWNHSTILVDYVKWIKKKNQLHLYHFYPSTGSETIFTLSESELNTFPKKISVFIDGNFDGRLIYQRVICTKI